MNPWQRRHIARSLRTTRPWRAWPGECICTAVAANGRRWPGWRIVRVTSHQPSDPRARTA